MIRFIHTADIHFGMENYGRIDPVTGIHTRLLDFDRALSFCVDVAIEKRVDFFLFSGDAYKTAHPSPTQQKLLLKSFMRLHRAKIPLIMVIGNHDHPLSFGKAHALDVYGDIAVDDFYVIAKPQVVTLSTKNGPVNIVGIPWPTRNTVALSSAYAQKSAHEITEYISSAVGAIIKDFASKLDPNIPAVLAAHMTVSTGVFSGSEKKAIVGTDPMVLPSQLAIPPFDYVALGHLHRHQNLNEGGYPAIVYSGSIERVDFGERKEDKGFCLVIINAKGDTSYEFIKTPTRPFIQIEVEVGSNALEQTDILLREIKRYELSDAVVKIVYHLPAGAHDKVDLALIEKACASAHYIVGIFPVRAVQERQRRAVVSSSMDVTQLLTAYFDAKQMSKDDKERLLQKMTELDQSSALDS